MDAPIAMGVRRGVDWCIYPPLHFGHTLLNILIILVKNNELITLICFKISLNTWIWSSIIQVFYIVFLPKHFGIVRAYFKQDLQLHKTWQSINWQCKNCTFRIYNCASWIEISAPCMRNPALPLGPQYWISETVPSPETHLKKWESKGIPNGWIQKYRDMEGEGKRRWTPTRAVGQARIPEKVLTLAKSVE